MVLLFGPGVGKIKLQAVQRLIRDAVLQDIQCVRMIKAHILDSIGSQLMQQLANAGAVNLNTNKKVIRLSLSLCKQAFAIAKTNLQNEWLPSADLEQTVLAGL